MKKLLPFLAAAFAIILSIPLVSCEDESDTDIDEVAIAAREMCDCMKETNNDGPECTEKFRKKYKYVSKDFADRFTSLVNECGVTVTFE